MKELVEVIAKSLVDNPEEVTVTDSRSPRDGRFIDESGYYDPTKEPSEIRVDEEAAKNWLENGAQPTQTVEKILKTAGIEK